jgi:hypothetical protein
MKTAGKLQRVSAAIAAVAVSFSIVWAISGYAYPDVSPASLGQMAKKSVPPIGLATPSETVQSLPANCRGCAPG